ncbi:MAG: amidohydrolase family protein [Flavobacteriales bacterium]|nr:amidohydrolase family protein [Flavobacteriales bacterium]
MRKSLFAFLFAPLLALSQSTPPPAHVRDAAPTLIAFTNATLHTDARTVVKKATLIIRDGEVITIGDKVSIPPNAVVRDLNGLHIWPALIEPYSDLGLVASTPDERKAENRAARHWNAALRADAKAHELYKADAERSAKLREQGYALVIAHRMDGIARGTSAAIALNDEPAVKSIVAPDAAAHFSFRKGSSQDSYPGSLMGSIALLRQTLLDAKWYATLPQNRETDAVLLDLVRQIDGRMVCEASERNDVLRWSKLLREFQLTGIVKGAGDEYARLPEIKAVGMPLIVPFAQPEAYDVEDPYDALEVTYARLKHWELAMRNAYLLDSAEITFALTAHGRKELKDIWKDLRKLVANGLDSAKAIEKLTSEPARLFGLDSRYGALRPGMRASFLITSQHLLHEKNAIHETWVEGKRFVIDDPDKPRLAGSYDLNLGDAIWLLEVTGEAGKNEATVRRPDEADSLKVKARLDLQGRVVSLSFAPKGKPEEVTRLNGSVHGEGGVWDGQGQRPGGAWFAWSAVRRADSKQVKKDASTPLGASTKPDSAAARAKQVFGPITYPLVGYGWKDALLHETIVIRNATVWTNTAKGILRSADVLIHEGKVKAVGEKLDALALFPGKSKPAIAEIDGTGKHLTCGIVDEHSHIAIARGVNEGSHYNTSEVRIGDVINPDDVNIYRNLAGGVTTIQQLHGSANPIGGQSAVIKLRWGRSADSLVLSGARPRIKFALGENVKQSNWGPSSRFPQTRMGVEQAFYDAFHQARAYQAEHDRWSVLKPKERDGKAAPRRDLRMEALAEILRGERDISCHSYVQSEIAMLMHVADSMGFKVNTFTHILEGYKVAQAMKRHGASASTFSDWWAYKLEVNDAIPHNAALLHLNGVHTGINSDDAEMSRRLNQEAAKAVKYGGVSAEEAWKMVTLNPARMLGLDHRVGAVEPGKDADLVLWSADPLSIDARALSTWVDGVRYYDEARDREQRAWIATERDRITRAMMQAKADGAPSRKPGRERPRLWHCDDMGDDEYMMDEHDGH